VETQIGIDFFELRNRLSKKFEELDKEAKGTVCRTCGKLTDDKDEWIPEAYTAMPIVICDECWSMFKRKYPYEECPDNEMIKWAESFLRAIHEAVLNQCGMSALIPRDEKDWHYLFFIACQQMEKQGWMLKDYDED
jgi:hypothetical protein